MREIVGFVMGAAAGAAGALFATSTEGRALVQRLREEARPEVERATTEWQPVLDELARAVRLAAREVETATADLRGRIAEIAAAPPADETAPEVAGQADETAPEVAGPADEVAAEPEPPAGPDPTAESRKPGET